MSTVIPQKPGTGTGNGNTVKVDNVVTVATTNITKTGEQIINGVSLVADDRVLLTGQTDASENGVWVVVAGVYGAWTRPTDFDTDGEASGTWTHIEQGTDHDESIWFCVTNDTCTIDTDDQEWRNVNEDSVDGFNISDLTEDSTNASGDFIAKHDGTGMEKIKRNDFIRTGVKTLSDAATVTINLAEPEKIYTVELAGNRTLAVTNATPGDEFILRLEQDGTGSRTVTWFDTINWPAGSAPTLTTTADRADYFRFVVRATNTFDNIDQALNLTTTLGSSDDLSGSILASWALGEASGTRADSVASFELSPSVSDPGNVAGKDGNAVDFTGANTQYLRLAVDAASEFSVGDSDFSISMWVNFDSIVSAQTILDANSKIVVSLNSSRADFNITGKGSVRFAMDLTAATWHLVVCVHDSTNDEIKLSLDGATFQTESISTGGVQTFTDGHLYLGSSDTPDNYMTGSLDAVNFWKNKALSQTEVTDLYNSGTGKFYPFA